MRRIKSWLLLLSMILVYPGFSSTAELKMVDLRYEAATGTNRSWEYEGKKVGELAMHLNYQFLKPLDLDINVNSKIDDNQFRYVELEPYLNLHLNKELILYLHHRSGHCLDCTYNNIIKFPNENGVGLKWIMFQK